MGSADAEYLMVKNIVSAIGCAAVSVDYRLAPETSHPGPVEDCYAALKWLSTHADELGIDPNRIAVGSSSSGGGLAAALALLTRDRGEVPLAFQFLIAPMLDDRTCTLAKPHPYTGNSSGHLRPIALAGPLCWARNLEVPMFRPMLQRHAPSIWRTYQPPLST